MAERTPTFSEGFNDGLRRLYDANKGDVNFICGSLNKNVHSLLLGARSKVFDAMLQSPFQEGLSKRIDLKEQDPHLAARMLQHLYGFDYSAHKTSIGDDEEPSYVSELHTHAEMYALGDEYDIKELKEEALWKFQKAIDAMKGHSEELPNILEVIPTVYATTPDSDRGLRDAIVAFGARDLDRIRDLPEFKSAATRVPIYLIEVLPKFFERFGGRYYESDCPTCDNADNWMFTHVECSKCQYEETLYDSEKAPASR